MDGDGHPLPAEDQVLEAGPNAVADLRLLLLGAARAGTLSGRARAAFLGRGGGQFLDPQWVGRR